MDGTQATQRQKKYWQRVSRLTTVLMLVWFAATFGTIFFARELAGIAILGWPFPFYMAGQGLTLLYLIIVAVYVKYMERIDKTLKTGADDAE